MWNEITNHGLKEGSIYWLTMEHKIFGEEIGSIHIKILYFDYVRLGGIPDIAWVILTKIWLFPETNGV